MDREIIFSANFNQGSTICTLQVVLENCDNKIIMIRHGEEITLVDAGRDQFGVWLDFEEFGIMQEDETKSFLDAYIQALQIIKKNNEFTEPCHVTISKQGEE